MAVADRDFAMRYVTSHFHDSFQYFVFPSESFDGNPLKPGEQVLPEGAGHHDNRIGPVPASGVVDLLWRDGLVPEWIDISVAAADSEHTFFELRCCGRFTADDSLLYYSERGQGPFGIKSPTFPPHWFESEGRFDLHSLNRGLAIDRKTPSQARGCVISRVGLGWRDRREAEGSGESKFGRCGEKKVWSRLGRA